MTATTLLGSRASRAERSTTVPSATFVLLVATVAVASILKWTVSPVTRLFTWTSISRSVI